MAHYVNNKELLEQLKISKSQGKLTPAAQEMLLNIIHRANRKLNYRSEQDKEDCIASACLDVFKYWDRYDTDKKNPLAYFTQIAKNGYAKGWNELYPGKYKGTISYDRGGDSEGIYSL